MRVEVEQRELVLQGADLRVGEPHVAAREAQLVEREPGLDLDREGARHDLEVELAAVAGADLVEAVVAVGEHAGEDVEPPGRALRVGLGAHVLGQRQLLDQRHQVGTVALEHGAVAQVDPLEGEALDLLLDGRVDVGQEGAAQGPGVVAEPQVDAGRLDRLGPDPVVAGADPVGGDRLVPAPARAARRPETRPRQPLRSLPPESPRASAQPTRSA